MLSCPYIPDKQKSKWIKEFFKSVQLASPTKAQMGEFLGKANTLYAHVDWEKIDLLNSLEKRELKKAY
ncbi:hypothetical protein D3C75_1359410 [compost metagenome]